MAIISYETRRDESRGDAVIAETALRFAVRNGNGFEDRSGILHSDLGERSAVDERDSSNK